MEYYFTKTIKSGFAEAIEKVTEGLKAEGFGILTEIDIKATLKKKLDVDFYNYTILGACNPPFAHKALQAEYKIETMQPCNGFSDLIMAIYLFYNSHNLFKNKNHDYEI